MSEETKKAPAIRFQGFSDAWEQRKLGDIAEIKTGPFGSTLHAEDYVQSGIPIITTEHFKSGHLPESKDGTPQVSDEDYSRLKSYILKKGDIVFSRVGSVDINALVTTLQDGWLFSGRVLRVRSQNQIDSDYLHYLLDTLPVKNDIVSRAVGQTMPSINTEILKSTKLVLSKNIEEQKLIAGTLRKLDDTLALHQRKLTLLEQLKQTYLQVMFPQGQDSIPILRFAGHSEPWEQHKLGEISESYSGGTPSVAIQSYYGGSIPFIRSAEINSKNTELYLTEEGLNNSSAKLVDVGDILYALYGATSGEVGISQINGAINQAILAIKPKIEYDSNFIMQWLRRQKMSIISTYLQGGQGNLSGSIVKDLALYAPTKQEEQTKIGSFFKQLDDTIALHQEKIAHLKVLKSTLLNKMFI